MSLLNFLLFFSYNELFGRHGGLKVSALLSGSSGVRSSSGWGHWVLSIMPKIPEISVAIQMERFVSVSSDRNTRDYLWRWSTYFGQNIPTEILRCIFDKPVHWP